MDLTEEDFLQWFAGFFDADGSVFYTSQGRIGLTVCQSEKIVLNTINNYYNGIFSETSSKRDKQNATVNRTQFVLRKTGKELYPVLLDLEKYSVIKNPQIRLALEFLKYRGNRDEKSRQKRREIGKKISLFNNDHTIQECINSRPYDENITIPYIAGLLDGDGCVTIGTNLSRYVKITQKNDPIILEKIKEMYEGSRYKEGDISVVFEKKYVLCTFLSDILPYLIYKKNQVLNFLEFLETDDIQRKMELRDKVKLAKSFDLDPEKYTQSLKNLFEDLDKNYTTEDLMLGKKLTELNETRITKSYDNQVFNTFEEYVKPRLIFCESRQQNVLWTYFRKRTSSITMSGQVGRSIRILVVDENSGKYIGIMAIGSDFYQISARDSEVKKYYPDIQVSEYINHVANITCCVPLQPFGYNCNGGKLLLKMAFSREVYDYWLDKYKQPLLILTTLGVNGKSVMYSRLKEIKLVGYTTGTRSNIHIPKEILYKCKTLFNHLELKNTRNGTMEMLNTLFSKTKIKVNYNKHITKKSVYLGWLFKSKLDDKSPSLNDLKTVCEISDEWRSRWCIKRLENVKANGTFRTGIELMSSDDLIFKNIKIYKLPTVFTEHKRKMEKQPEKEHREQELLIAQRLTDDNILFLLQQKGLLTTEEASNRLFELFNIRIPRNEISKLYLGEFLPSKTVISSEIYRKAMQNHAQRVYTKPKSEAWKEAIRSENRKQTIDNETLLEIMRCKKKSQTAEECSKNFRYTSGSKIGKELNRSIIQNIWSGKQKPNEEITLEYQELLDYKRSRKTT